MPSLHLQWVMLCLIQILALISPPGSIKNSSIFEKHTHVRANLSTCNIHVYTAKSSSLKVKKSLLVLHKQEKKTNSLRIMVLITVHVYLIWQIMLDVKFTDPVLQDGTAKIIPVAQLPIQSANTVLLHSSFGFTFSPKPV